MTRNTPVATTPPHHAAEAGTGAGGHLYAVNVWLPPNRSLAESVPAAALLVREMPDQVYRDPNPVAPAPPGGRPPWDVYDLSLRLDPLTALRDRERVEREAPSLLRPGTYFEPFALRALGVVREEAELLEQAIARFEAMDLHWHETQTRALLAARR